ncbi:N-alpha-acetyltransferase 40 [Chelonus insularis]|uniref:N-alpha-acetyltransferase 40 n=1 Tax=Chelonus insularis TaxID=460826 RepID=UPI00158937EF|nr:N-alpha-acetyltransferase 40 [Chelonus insularis]
MKNKKGHQTRRQKIAVKEAEAQSLVEKANSIQNPLETLPNYHSYTAKNGVTYDLKCQKVQDLAPELLSWIFDLMERNMKSFYQRSSWGWNENAKHNELTEPTARYLIAFHSNEPVGFSHFRFDLDDKIQVLYCYELQLEPRVVKQGLGRFMMDTLAALANQSLMKKVVLTVLKHNPNAREFFKHLGYKVDKTNPPDWENLDYEILSKENK